MCDQDDSCAPLPSFDFIVGNWRRSTLFAISAAPSQQTAAQQAENEAE